MRFKVQSSGMFLHLHHSISRLDFFCLLNSSTLLCRKIDSNHDCSICLFVDCWYVRLPVDFHRQTKFLRCVSWLCVQRLVSILSPFCRCRLTALVPEESFERKPVLEGRCATADFPQIMLAKWKRLERYQRGIIPFYPESY